MDLDDLRALLAVVEHGSFIAAARETSLPRSTLRRRIDALEAEVGAPLLVRSPAGVALTTAGEVVAREGRHVLEHARDLLLAADEARRAAPRTLSVVIPLGMPPEMLTATYLAFTSTFSAYRVDLAMSENPRAALVEDADLVVTIDGDTAAGPWERFVVRPIQIWLVATPEYLERHGTPATPADLARHTIVAWRPPRGLERGLPLRAGGHVEITPRLLTGDAHLLRQIASAGVALAYAPDALFGPFPPAPGGLVPVLPEVVGRQSALEVLLPRTLADDPAMRQLVLEVRMLLRVASAAPSR